MRSIVRFPVKRASAVWLRASVLLIPPAAPSSAGMHVERAPRARIFAAVPAPAPAPRSGHAMTYDAARGVVVLFGGGGSTLFGDTWTWNGSAWTLAAREGPSPRDGAILVFDTKRSRVVLFGGRSNGTLLNDTWEWDGNRWTERAVQGPPTRMHGTGAYDAKKGRVRVYGGVASNDTPLRDTWEFDGVQWTQVGSAFPATRPPTDMAFDASRGTTVVMTANVETQNADKTVPSSLFEWTASGWSAIGGVGPSFSPMQPMATLGARGGLVLVDGGALQGVLRAWIFRDGTWTAAPGEAPPPRNSHAIAYDGARNRLVLFGGFRNGADFGDTWEWDGARWQRRAATDSSSS